jgi:putative endonuclease
MAFVYILKSRDFNITYTGSTVDLERRIAEHNNGESNFTKKFIPWKIIYTEEYADLSEARFREKYFKTYAGRKLIKKIIEGR